MKRYVKDERETLIAWQAMAVTGGVFICLSLIYLVFGDMLFSNYMYFFIMAISLAEVVAVLYQYFRRAFFTDYEYGWLILLVWLLQPLVFYMATAKFRYPAATDKPLDRYSLLAGGCACLLLTIFATIKWFNNRREL